MDNFDPSNPIGMYNFDPSKYPIGSCPHVTKLQEVFKYPSLSITFIIIGLTSLFFAIYTIVKFNTVIVFDKPVRSPPISNNWWIAYFIAIALRVISATTESTTFALDGNNETVTTALIILSLIMSGLSTFALTLALNHQRKYRSDFGPADPSRGDSATFPNSTLQYNTALAVNSESERYTSLEAIRDTIVGPVSLFLILLLVYGLAMYLVLTNSHEIFFISFMIAYGLQRVPVLVLAFWIVFNIPKTPIEGPSLSSKIILLFASVLDLVNNLPVTIWARIIKNDKCTFCILGYVDLIHLLFCVAQVLFFIFLRAEFIRNKEQFVYTTVQTHKDYEQLGFEWKVFNSTDITRSR